jgi:hypothetical protein
MKKRVWGGVAAGLLLAAGGLAAARLQKERRVERVWRSLQLPSREERFHRRMVEGLPEPARRYLLHAIQPGTRLARAVELDMTGFIALGRSGAPFPMTSEQIIAPPYGYIWKARAGRGALRFSGFDVYADGRGEMRWWTAGIVPVVRGSGAELSRSAVGRLLGETIFVPSLLLPSEDVRWEAVDDSTARVWITAEAEDLAMTMEVDARGSLVRASFPRWNSDPKIGPLGYLRFVTEKLSEERTFNGFTIPTRFESGWRLGEPDELRFFFAKIERAEYVL